jgi:hypothetical protein
VHTKSDVTVYVFGTEDFWFFGTYNLDSIVQTCESSIGFAFGCFSKLCVTKSLSSLPASVEHTQPLVSRLETSSG